MEPPSVVTLCPRFYLPNFASLAVSTDTLADQSRVEDDCIEIYKELALPGFFEENSHFLSNPLDVPLPRLNKACHVVWLEKLLKKFFDKRHLVDSMESSKNWTLYWISHSLDMLDAYQDKIYYKKMIIEFIKSTFDCVCGGFGGGPGQLAHLASNYAAVMCLIVTGDREALELIDRQRMYDFIYSLKDAKTGGFRMHIDGEVDMRGAYLAVSVASILHIVTEELFDGLEDYVRSRQTYEGGIAGESDVEAHGGYTYCGFVALCILGKAEKLDLSALLKWVAFRQMGNEGGFQGRSNKLVDACYSFWVGGVFAALREALFKAKKPFPINHQWFAEKNLQMYLLCCCQVKNGGFRDKPGVHPDPYHTCYSLSGLSLAERLISEAAAGFSPEPTSASQNLPPAQLPCTLPEDSVGGNSNFARVETQNVAAEATSSLSTEEIRMLDLLPVSSLYYNVRELRLKNAREYFKSLPFIEKKLCTRGTEGHGVS